MMTKDEMIDAIIERYKSYKNKSFVNLVDCCGMDCENCPFKVTECADGVIKAIIERFVKAEESQKAETNLEHYYDSKLAFDEGETDDIYTLCFKTGTDEAYKQSGIRDFKKWLLSPYEEPKPKYKLGKFEYDLLKSCYDDLHGIKDSWMLDNMHDKGYFKDIPTDVQIKDILDNCEVVEK